ncbi:MAG: Holliday junction branch migration protein RuvA [Prevotella sp.]|nr:Holliday junction branch migration protein RuvA [Alistipes senegalensis]MCM1357155.1 Holliday junction branch migration protein RuvA [Prevotella sp.]MCM1472527.1 Holliday junction branch migration protein RuvA [Muribaculaceae bacterium]
MIYSLKGILIVKDMNFIVVECNGVGYSCKTSYNTISQLGATGSEVMVYTHMNVRDDNIELFGFATLQELNCFRLLISVSGVGGKAATSILSDITPENFAFLVASGDSKAFTRTKGIGAKTAQRIVLELKDKISAESFTGKNITAPVSAVDVSSSAVSEAMEALMVLGYSQGEIAPLLRKCNSGMNTQELIREVLRLIASGNI